MSAFKPSIFYSHTRESVPFLLRVLLRWFARLGLKDGLGPGGYVFLPDAGETLVVVGKKDGQVS